MYLHVPLSVFDILIVIIAIFNNKNEYVSL